MVAWLDTLPDAAARWLPALVDATLKGTLLLAVAGLATTYGMRRAAAATRHLVWSAAVVAVLALPVLSLVAPQWTAPVIPAALVRAAAALRSDVPAATATDDAATPRFRVERATGAPALSTHDVPEAVGAALQVVPPTTPGAEPARVTVAPRTLTVRVPHQDAAAASSRPATLGWGAALLGVWLAGVALVLLRLVLGTAGLARLVRRAAPADDPTWVMPLQRLARELGIRRPVSLYVGRTGTVPVTWGVVYPVVLLPADAAEWSEERRRAVLLHELAHVERLDALTQVLAQLAMALFWFNPLVALAARRLRAERERACDDLVLAAGGVPATRYADDLLDLVRTLGEASPAAAALAMARRSEFEGRLLAILDPAAPRTRTDRRRALAAGALVAVAAVPLAGMRAATATAASAHPVDEQIAEAIAPRLTPAPTRPATPPPPAGRPTPTPSAAAVRTPAPTVGVLPDLAPVSRGLAALGARLSAVTPTPSDICVSRRGENVLVGDGPTFSYVRSDDARCLELRTAGAVELTDDQGDVRALAPGGRLLLIDAPRGGTARRMELVPDGARLVRRYSVGGEERPADEGAGWFRAAFADAARRSGLGADARIARLLREQGVAGVLADVRGLDSDGLRRKYLLRLLEVPTLDEAALLKVAEATRGMTSDGDRAAVLARLSERMPASGAVGAAVVGATRGMTSDGDRRRVLLTTPIADLPAAVVADVARAVGGMTSDGDRAAVLLRIVPRAGETAAIRDAFFGAMAGMTSDAERRRVLVPTVERWGDDATLAAALDATRPMTSDEEKTDVLRAVAAKRRMESAAVRERYFRRVASFTSETARERVLLAALRAEPSCADTQREVIAATRGFTSDTRRSAVLLAVARETAALRDSTMRAGFLASLKGITSSAEYRRVMEALVP